MIPEIVEKSGCGYDTIRYDKPDKFLKEQKLYLIRGPLKWRGAS